MAQINIRSRMKPQKSLFDQKSLLLLFTYMFFKIKNVVKVIKLIGFVLENGK